MTHDPKHTPDTQPDTQQVPDAGDKPADLSDAEWAAIREAWADVAAGRVYTQEEIEAEVRARQAARRRKAR
ncbi:MAG: hypothetical protein U5L06_11270 [Rhodovibrio sp.]|nr:hypothetical protein [Rhodovibrio sp.]